MYRLVHKYKDRVDLVLISTRYLVYIHHYEQKCKDFFVIMLVIKQLLYFRTIW